MGKNNQRSEEAIFRECEYKCLRDEIREIRSRLYQSVVVGAIGIPAISLVTKQDITDNNKYTRNDTMKNYQEYIVSIQNNMQDPSQSYEGSAVELLNIGLIVLLPFIVIAFMFKILADHNSMMRCGKYIRTKIEKDFCRGWECWLESRDNTLKRTPESWILTSYFILFGAYYLGTVLLSLRIMSIVLQDIWMGVY